MKKVLLTGGTGYIGQYMGKTLKENGYEVIITSRAPNDIVMGHTNRHMELLDVSTISGICNGIETVIHMANLDEQLIVDQPRETFLANAYATRELFRDALNSGVKHFIYLSTFHVYGLNAGQIDEDTKPKPKTDYALSHLFAEEYLEQMSRECDCKVSIIRLTNGIGLPLHNVQKWYLVINDFCKTAYFDKRIDMISNGLPVRDFVAIKDIVDAIITLLNKVDIQQTNFEVYNISAQKTYSIRDIAYMVKEIYERRYVNKIILNLPEITEAQINEVKPLKISSEKIRSLGWIPKLDVNDVIEDIFQGLENGMYDSKTYI